MTVIEYCTEEVERQGHDTSVLDGIERVGWMLDAWSYALDRAKDGDSPTVEDVVALGKLVERKKNKRGLRKCGVYIRTNAGIKEFPKFDQVPQLLESLFEQIHELTPMEFYKALVGGIHPFRDGNGRSGKVILNWLHGSLLEPIFPPIDLFGEPIRNP